MTEHVCSNCGTRFSDEQFCPQCGQWADPLADEEFEHFELGAQPPEGDYQEYYDTGEVASIPYASVTCTSCGAANPESNRHCEECGARLSQAPLPVAPQPLLQTSAGVRAAIMIAAVLVGVILIAWLFRTITGDDTDGTTAGNDGASTTTSSSVVASIQQIPVLGIDCSSEFAQLPCENLIDGSAETYWNDEGLEGQGASIQVVFGEPVALEQIVVMNVVDEEKFTRNFRIRSVEIVADDVSTPFAKTLEDKSELQTIRLQTLATTILTINVTATYPAEAYTDEEGNVGVPFTELALAELQFFGKPSG